MHVSYTLLHLSLGVGGGRGERVRGRVERGREGREREWWAGGGGRGGREGQGREGLASGGGRGRWVWGEGRAGGWGRQ